MTYMSFDVDPTLQVLSVFLNMSKVFDKVWHEGLIYELRQVDISGEALPHISTTFLITDSSV